MFETIEIGAAEDDGTGDSLRRAFEKVNENFARLSEALSEMSAATGDARTDAAPEWPGSFVARHVTDGAPDMAPPMLGAVWVDAEAQEVYVSVGTDAVSDWVLLSTREA